MYLIVASCNSINYSENNNNYKFDENADENKEYKMKSKNYFDFFKVCLESIYKNSPGNITCYLVNFKHELINYIKNNYKNITILSKTINNLSNENFRNHMMCSRYELLKQILSNNNKWCIYIDLDMIVRKNLNILIKKINIDTPIIYILQPRSFKIDKNDEPYYLHKKRDKNTVFNTGLIAMNNNDININFLNYLISYITKCLKSDKLISSVTKIKKKKNNYIWLPDQYSFYMSYLKFRKKIFFAKLERTYNDNPHCKNGGILFNKKSVIWHSKGYYSKKFIQEYKNYLQNFNKKYDNNLV
jgi:hypothetical protein